MAAAALLRATLARQRLRAVAVLACRALEELQMAALLAQQGQITVRQVVVAAR
jgi:hypothetical protein